jgi:diguanylate cyclase
MAITTKSEITDRASFLRQMDRASHHGNVPLAVALTDLDDFEEINDVFGFDAGDAVLAAWESVLAANLPPEASVSRLGGDEYALALPGLSAETAVVLMEEIREHFSSQPIPGIDRAVGVSVGIASDPPHGSTPEDLWRAVGQALMRAKRGGRNSSAIYVDEKMTLKSNYYTRAGLDRLAKLSGSSQRTEASLLREALDDLLDKYRAVL